MSKDWLIKISDLDKSYNLKSIKEDVDELVAKNNLPDSSKLKMEDDVHSTNLSINGPLIYSYNLVDFSKELKDASELVIHLAKEAMIESKILTGDFDLEFDDSWTVYGYKGAYHRMHHHIKDFNGISTVLYLAMSEHTEHHECGSFYAVLDGECPRYKTNYGDLIIFPSHLPHGTYPQGRGLRQTLNFDFRIKI
jgi:hypothetical protein